jgi:citrate lyase subunit beta/citryl-CoA lyase
MKGLRRSLQWVIGGDEAMLQQALRSHADAIVFELEDLCPAENKIKARQAVVKWLQEVNFGDKEVGVRINSFDSPWGREDLNTILPCHVDFLRIPKCENVRDVLDIDAIMTQYELTHNRPQNTTELILMLETPLGIRNAYELASCSKRVTGLNLGAVDLTNAMGVKRDLTEGSLQLVYAKEKLVMDAKAAGVDAFDTAVFCPPGRDAGMEELVRKDTETIKQMGFTGRSVSNLTHIDIINRVFSDSEEEIARAKQIVRAYEEAPKSQKAHVFVNGQYVDKPVYERALKVLRRNSLKGAAE